MAQEIAPDLIRRVRAAVKTARHPILKGLLAAAGAVIFVTSAVTYGLTSHPAAAVLRSPVASVLRSPAASVLRVAGYSACGSGVGDGSGLRQGSGFVAAPGTVVTDAHVIYGDRDPMVQASGRYYPATVVLFDPADDLAVLRTSAPLPPPLATAPTRIGTTGTLGRWSATLSAVRCSPGQP